MSRLPTVTFVDELPTERNERERRLVGGWVPYVLAHLEQRPGDWAHVDASGYNTANIKKTCEAAGLNVEVSTRNRNLYMRLIP